MVWAVELGDSHERSVKGYLSAVLLRIVTDLVAGLRLTRSLSCSNKVFFVRKLVWDSGVGSEYRESFA